jgi:DNA replication protein DnaC
MSAFYRHVRTRSPHWINLSQWLSKYQDWRFRDPTVTWSMMENIRRAEYLFIDDCGVRAENETQQALLYDVLTIREKRPTLITGNFEPAQLSKVFDSRITSRLCAGVILKVIGPDRRLSGGKIVEVRG